MQEAVEEIGMSLELASARAELANDGLQAVGTEVGGNGALHPSPDPLDRIELRRVGGETLDREPAEVRLEKGVRLGAAMSFETVPEPQDRSAYVATKMPEEAHDFRRVDRTAVSPEKDPGALSPAGTIRNRSDHRELVPAALTMNQNRRLTARRPRAPDRGTLGETTFVEEDDGGASASGVFFSAGQRSLRQRAIAGSSRSRARVVGFCSDQPSWRNSRQTWPG